MSHLIVHYMGCGLTACMRQGPPKLWPDNHRWSSDWNEVTCNECLLGQGEIKTYVISTKGDAITCLRCRRTSYCAKDVEHRFCGCCGVYHDNIWPPARMWWLKNPPPSAAQIPAELQSLLLQITKHSA